VQTTKKYVPVAFNQIWKFIGENDVFLLASGSSLESLMYCIFTLKLVHFFTTHNNNSNNNNSFCSMCCGTCAIVVSNNEKRTPQPAPHNKYGSGLSITATGPTTSTGNSNKMRISQSYQRTVRDLTPAPVRLQDEALVSCSKIISQQQNYLNSGERDSEEWISPTTKSPNLHYKFG
jgi:hypothetical protein